MFRTTIARSLLRVNIPFNTTRLAVRRDFSEAAAPKQSRKTGLYVGSATLLVGGGLAFYFLGGDSAKEAGSLVKSGTQSLKAASHFTPTKKDYNKVYEKITGILDTAEGYDDGSYGPVFLRLAWHASGTYDKESGTGGSNYATMRFAPESLHGANNGLKVARDLMEGVKKEFPWISYGDLWTLGGVAAVQPKIPWRPGRIDGFEKDVTPDGRLPDASQGCDHLRNVFYRQGFNDQEIVALSGAHAVGRCHPDRSGFEGPWTFSPVTFSNQYFKLLFVEKWVWKKWSGAKQLVDKKTGGLMMLPTDYILTQDKSFKKHAKLYAQDESKFFADFSSAFSRMLENGVPITQFTVSEFWVMGESD